MSWKVLALLAVLGSGVAWGASPTEVEQERAQVRAKLAQTHEVLDALKGQKGDLLGVLDTYGRLIAFERARAADLETWIGQLGARRRILAEAVEARRREVASQLKRLGPRLRALDRLSRRSRLDLLLSAKDFAALVWRARALKQITRGDLAALDRLRKALTESEAEQGSLDEVDRMLAAKRAEAHRAVSMAHRTELSLQDALSWVEAQASQSSRLLHELQRSDASLSRLIREMTTSAKTGFGALKGKLPMPTDGQIEMGYGNVMEAKFHTVTLHKGLDIRAPEGTPVRAVAKGKVVYEGWLQGYGNLMIVDDGGGFDTLMAHLERFDVKVGAEVKAGDVLGEVGDTGSIKGAYLYFEIRQDGQAVDPSLWLK